MRLPIVSDYTPACEGEARELFESIPNFRSDEAREAAIKCASCLLVEACRRSLLDETDIQRLNLPTVRSGVYISGKGTRRVVDLFPGNQQAFNTDIEISYGRFIDSEDPLEVIAELRKLMREDKISLKGGKGERRKAALIGVNSWSETTEDKVKLRHFKALYQARSKGYLLGYPLLEFERTIGLVLQDYEEWRDATDESTAGAVVAFFKLENLSEFFDAVGEDNDIPDWTTKRFLYANRKDPQAALSRYQQDCTRLLASETAQGVPLTIVRRLALQNPIDPESALVAFHSRVGELRAHVVNPRAAKPSTLTYIALHNSRNHLKALERFEEQYEKLLIEFGEAGLDPTSARLFALNFPNEARGKAIRFVQDLRELRVQFGDTPSLGEDRLRIFARLYDSPAEAIGTYLENVKRLTQRYPNIPYNMICVISRNLITAEGIAAEVDVAQKELTRLYGNNTLVTTEVINSLANRFRVNAIEAMETYLQNVEYLRTEYSRYGIDISLLSNAALYHPKSPDSAMKTLLQFMGILAWPRRGPISLNRKLDDSGSMEMGDLVKGGISAEDEYFRIQSREFLATQASEMLDSLDGESREQIEIYFGFKNSPDGSMPDDQDIDQILKSLRGSRR